MRIASISARIRRVIHVQDFHKNYSETVAVAGLTFDVQPGQILGLLGPNGGGEDDDDARDRRDHPADAGAAGRRRT